MKDLLADAAQRMIPILQKLEQLRKENWLRSSSQHRTSSFSCSRGVPPNSWTDARRGQRTCAFPDIAHHSNTQQVEQEFRARH